MKKFYFLFLFALIASISNLYAAEKTVTFDATVDKSSGTTLTKDGITLSLEKGTSTTSGSGCGPLDNGTDYRPYKGNILTISSEYNITKIVFTCTANGTAKGGPGGFKTSSGYSYKDKTGTWEGTSKSIAFKAEVNQVRAKTIKVTYDAPEETKCATPTFNLENGKTYADAQTLEITSTTADATIHYTINGGAETTGQPAAFTENGVYTVDAWATKDNLTASDHTSIKFTIAKKMNKPTFNLTEGAVYGEAKVLEITSDKVGAQIEYTIVGGGNINITKTEASPVNVTLNQNGEYMVEAFALGMDDYAKSDAAGLNFKIELAAGVPTFSVEEGTYPEAQTIALAPGEGGEKVFYTINDGTEQQYIEPIKLEEEGTYKIAAYTAGTETLAKSATVTKTYVINLPLEEPYILCEDAAWLTEGANIIFASSVAAGEQKAMSKLQKTNNRGAASVTIGSAFNAGKETVGIVSKDADVAVFTVGISNGHITFYTGDSKDEENNEVAGYLYAAGSGSGKNYLRTTKIVDPNAEWSVSVAANGAATIKAQGANTNNLMRYNPNNGNPNPMFSCYTGGQDPIYIYLLGKTSSVSSMSAEGVKVFAAEGGVEVVAEEAAEVAVYTAAGQLVRQARVAEGSTLVNVAPGFYVVRANDTATKVIVR